MTRHVVVAGAGVAGLSTAHRLLVAEPSLDVTVLEASAEVGGRVRAVPVGHLELDAGPEAFVARKPWAVDLCRELGLPLTEPSTHGAFLWTDRGLVRLLPTAMGVTASIGGLASWKGLSGRGRARALADLAKRPRAPGDEETVGVLVRRRLGDEVAELLVQSLLGGLFAGDIDALGVRSTFPELEAWERDWGSLIHGARAALEKGADAGPMFARPEGGTAALPLALASAVGAERVRTLSAATAVREEGPRFVVSAGEVEYSADAVVLGTSAPVTAAVLADVAPVAAAELAKIPYVSVAAALLVYPEGTADALPEATGFVVPAGKAPMTAASFVSRTWPQEAFGTRAVVRCTIGGAGAEDVLDAADVDIVEAVARHLGAVLPLPARPSASAVVRWRSSMPQYEVGHAERVDRTVASLPPGIFVVGDAYRGAGVADTVRLANQVADEVLTRLRGPTVEREQVG